jgi:Uma2 family endonuclease
VRRNPRQEPRAGDRWSRWIGKRGRCSVLVVSVMAKEPGQRYEDWTVTYRYTGGFGDSGRDVSPDRCFVCGVWFWRLISGWRFDGTPEDLAVEQGRLV